MKPFANKNQQIDILISRNLTFSNIQIARNLIMRYGYYEIVNGYKKFLLDDSENTEKFRDGATFNQLFSLYEVDKNIRNGVLKATLEIELALRTAIAYTLSEDFGVEERDYLYYRNFRQGDTIWSDGRVTNERAVLLDKLYYLANKNVEPLNHYRENHGHIPPWILLKESTFGNLKYLFKLLKGPQKNKVISICLGIDINSITNEQKAFFKDSLSLIGSFRNRAAHSGRIFNFKSNIHKLKYNSFFHNEYNISRASYRKGIGQSDIYTLSKVLDLFDNRLAKINLDFSLRYHIRMHCNTYNDDLLLFSKEMNYPIDELSELIK